MVQHRGRGGFVLDVVGAPRLILRSPLLNRITSVVQILLKYCITFFNIWTLLLTFTILLRTLLFYDVSRPETAELEAIRTSYAGTAHRTAH